MLQAEMGSMGNHLHVAVMAVHMGRETASGLDLKAGRTHCQTYIFYVTTEKSATI